MYPEDRVLVGVINTKRDLQFARDAGWYRIPYAQMARGVYTEYMAFFLSGQVFQEQSGTIPYYARRRGVELARRRDLIPNQPNHSRADNVYFRISLGELQHKTPLITNPTKRKISFIHTTWDRFMNAREIKDLYSDADYFVDRIYHALRNDTTPIERFWEANQRLTGQPAQLRILCQRGEVIASTAQTDDAIYLDASKSEADLLTQIRAAIAQQNGCVPQSD